MTTAGQGFMPVRHLNGGQIRTRIYYVPSTDSTALYVGDPVELKGAMDSTGQFATEGKWA